MNLGPAALGSVPNHSAMSLLKMTCFCRRPSSVSAPDSWVEFPPALHVSCDLYQKVLPTTVGTDCWMWGEKKCVLWVHVGAWSWPSVLWWSKNPRFNIKDDDTDGNIALSLKFRAKTFLSSNVVIWRVVKQWLNSVWLQPWEITRHKSSHWKVKRSIMVWWLDTG